MMVKENDAQGSYGINIFSTKKNKSVTLLNVKELKNTGAQYIRIYVPPKEVKIFKEYFDINQSLSTPNLEIRSDEEIDTDGKFRLNLINRLESRTERAGWYYQQYLKIKSAYISEFPTWILDGDTFFSRSLIEDCTSKKLLLCTKEDVKHYNASLKKIFGNLIVPTQSSFIANGCFIDPQVLHKLISCVEDTFLLWLDDILEKNSGDISEYQLFGNAMKSLGYGETRALFFRRADLLIENNINEEEIIRRLSPKYNIIAFELSHKSNFLRRLIAKLLERMSYSW